MGQEVNPKFFIAETWIAAALLSDRTCTAGGKTLNPSLALAKKPAFQLALERGD